MQSGYESCVEDKQVLWSIVQFHTCTLATAIICAILCGTAPQTYVLYPF